MAAGNDGWILSEGAMSLPTLYSFEGISSWHSWYNDGDRCFDLKTAFYNRFHQESLPCTSQFIPFNPIVGHIFYFYTCLFSLSPWSKLDKLSEGRDHLSHCYILWLSIEPIILKGLVRVKFFNHCDQTPNIRALYGLLASEACVHLICESQACWAAHSVVEEKEKGTAAGRALSKT